MSSMTTLNLPELTSITSCELINGCTLLNTFTADKLESITDSDYNFPVFNACPALTTLSFPSLKTLSGRVFENFDTLESIDMPVLESIRGFRVFYNCTSLVSIDCPALLSIDGGYAFGGCTALTSVNMPELTDIKTESTFSGCTALTSVNVPKLNVLTASCFSGCSALIELNFPALATISGSGNFTNCTSLKTLRFGSLTSVYYNTQASNTPLSSVYFQMDTPPSNARYLFQSLAATEEERIIYVPGDSDYSSIETYATSAGFTISYTL